MALIRVLSEDEALPAVLDDLGVPTLGRAAAALYTEVVSAVLRRAAGLLCPCPRVTLTHAVAEALACFGDESEARAVADEAVDLLVGHGDLREMTNTRSGDEASELMVYCAPPAFVSIAEGLLLLLGIAPDNAEVLPSELAALVEFHGHARRIPLRTDTAAVEALRDTGLLQISRDAWTRAPSPVEASDFVTRHDRALDKGGPPGTLEGLKVVTPGAHRYYRGRWVDPGRRSGSFVARRKQRFGADLWCYVRLDAGVATALVDLPIDRTRNEPACDAAWRLLAAQDACSRSEQQVRVRVGDDRAELDFFSPVPGWARRRWEATGTQVRRGAGALFTYAFPRRRVDDELRFAARYLWFKTELDAEPNVEIDVEEVEA